MHWPTCLGSFPSENLRFCLIKLLGFVRFSTKHESKHIKGFGPADLAKVGVVRVGHGGIERWNFFFSGTSSPLTFSVHLFLFYLPFSCLQVCTKKKEREDAGVIGEMGDKGLYYGII